MTYLLAYIYIFWLLYVLCASAKNAWHKLSIPVRVLLIPCAVVGGVMDVAFNILVATVLLLDPPHEWTFTQRLDRYEVETGWRQTFALYICRNFLNPFAVGNHCTK